MPRTSKKTPAKTSHTPDGIPIVNATLPQIRKSRQSNGGGGSGGQQLVRIPQKAERSQFYAETAEVIGERESYALPYHGGRMWKCEVKISDDNGAYGDNGKNLKLKGNVNLEKQSRETNPGAAKRNTKTNNHNLKNTPPKNYTNYKSLTPLFRWFRGKLQLATLPHILEDIVEVDAKMPAKKRWGANIQSDDELDSSDDEWDEYLPPPSNKNVLMEISALTTSAWEDPHHPLPTIVRTWISPNLQKFTSRKSALNHAEELVRNDLLIDRILYGYGKNGLRLRPIKPTRKMALDAGMVRFLRDGVWVVGQEELWIEKRREIYVKKQMKMLKAAEEEKEGKDESEGEGDCEGVEEKQSLSTNAEEEACSSGNVDSATVDRIDEHGINNKIDQEEERKSEGGELDDEKCSPMKKACTNDNGGQDQVSADSIENTTIEEIDKPCTNDENDGKKEETKCTTIENKKDPKIISPMESDSSCHDESITAKTLPVGSKPSNAISVTPKCRNNMAIPPPYTPSTHYCLSSAQIDKCYTACVEHYEKVMMTVKARSLHHELSDGFDVLRERGRGRYDMELSAFDDTDQFSFLTDTRRAAWMPVVHKILGEDAILVHKGCFLSLPGSETQVYHQDGVHLNKKTQKPCHAVNVFIPLIDYDMTNGPTEFCLGSHYLGYENFVKEMVYTPCVTAGTPVIFDYRLGHRGLKNSSQNCRPVIYLTYSAVASGKEFRDSVNFSSKRYRKLGDFVERPLSREERAKKRRKKEEEE